MLRQFRKIAVAAGAAATIATGAMIPRPASADTTSTLLTAAAVVGGVVLYNNYQHKRAAAAQANQIVGYTRNGGTVYGDGRVVMPNGQTYYQNNAYAYNNAANGNYGDQRGRWHNDNAGDNRGWHGEDQHGENR